MLWETNEKQSTVGMRPNYQINYLIISEIEVCQLPQEMIEVRVNFFYSTSTAL